MTGPVSFWTAERTEQLKKLWDNGLSASQIATEIGNCTRNAVIGKVHRLGLAGRSKVIAIRQPRPSRAGQSAVRVPAKIAGTIPPQVNRGGWSPDAPPLPEGRHYKPVHRGNPSKVLHGGIIRKAGQPEPLMIPFTERSGEECSYFCSPDGEPRAVCGHPVMTIRGQRGAEKASYCPFHYGLTHKDYAKETA
jgi:GcrA cell cycle regulator